MSQFAKTRLLVEFGQRLRAGEIGGLAFFLKSNTLPDGQQ